MPFKFLKGDKKKDTKDSKKSAIPKSRSGDLSQLKASQPVQNPKAAASAVSLKTNEAQNGLVYNKGAATSASKLNSQMPAPLNTTSSNTTGSSAASTNPAIVAPKALHVIPPTRAILKGEDYDKTLVEPDHKGDNEKEQVDNEAMAKTGARKEGSTDASATSVSKPITNHRKPNIPSVSSALPGLAMPDGDRHIAGEDNSKFVSFESPVVSHVQHFPDLPESSTPSSEFTDVTPTANIALQPSSLSIAGRLTEEEKEIEMLRRQILEMRAEREQWLRKEAEREERILYLLESRSAFLHREAIDSSSSPRPRPETWNGQGYRRDRDYDRDYEYEAYGPPRPRRRVGGREYDSYEDDYYDRDRHYDRYYDEYASDRDYRYRHRSPGRDLERDRYVREPGVSRRYRAEYSTDDDADSFDSDRFRGVNGRGRSVDRGFVGRGSSHGQDLTSDSENSRRDLRPPTTHSSVGRSRSAGNRNVRDYDPYRQNSTNPSPPTVDSTPTPTSAQQQQYRTDNEFPIPSSEMTSPQVMSPIRTREPQTPKSILKQPTAHSRSTSASLPAPVAQKI